MELRTEGRLAAGGEAVARATDGRVVFVVGAAPDERVEVEVTETRARFLRARVLRVIEPGPSRVEPRCRHFGTCGGCALQHVDAATQRSAKTEAFVETLRRVGHADVDRITFESPWAGEPWGYRTRARMAVSSGVLGYRAAHSRAVVPIEECPVLVPALESRLDALSEAIATTSGDRELDLLAIGDRVLAHGGRAVLEAVAGVVEIAGEAEIVDGRGALIVDAAGFAQSSESGNAALLEAVERWTRTLPGFAANVVELYAGSGNFTRVLAQRAPRVVAIEGSAEAAERCRRTMPPHVEVIAEPVEQALAGLGPFAAAFADPPRSGLHSDVPAQLAACKISSLVMVSCDPGTFARDVARLAEHGIRLVRARLFDLYPHTAHAEVAGVFEA